MNQFQHHTIRASNSLYDPLPPHLYSQSKSYVPLRFVNHAPNVSPVQEIPIYYPSPNKTMVQPQVERQNYPTQRISANQGNVSFSHRTQASMYVQNPVNVSTSQVATKFKELSIFEENSKKMTETSKALDSIKQELRALEQANKKRTINANSVTTEKSPQKQQVKQTIPSTELQFKPKNPDVLAKRSRDPRPSFYDIQKVIPAHLLQSPKKQPSSQSQESPEKLFQSAKLPDKTEPKSENLIASLGQDSPRKQSTLGNSPSAKSQKNETNKDLGSSINRSSLQKLQVEQRSPKNTSSRDEKQPIVEMHKSTSKGLLKSSSKEFEKDISEENEKMWRNLVSAKVSETQLKEQENKRLLQQIQQLKKKLQEKQSSKKAMKVEYQSRQQEKRRRLSQLQEDLVQKDSFKIEFLREFGEREDRYIKQIQFLKGKVSKMESSQSNFASKQFNEALKAQLIEIDQLKAKVENKEEQIAEMKETLLNKDSELMQLKQEHMKEINIFKAEAKRAESSRDVQSNDNANEQQSLRRALQSIESKLRVALKEIQEKDDFVGKCLVGRAKDLNDQEYIKTLVKQYELQLPTYKIADKLVEEAATIERLERELKVQQIMNTHY